MRKGSLILSSIVVLGLAAFVSVRGYALLSGNDAAVRRPASAPDRAAPADRDIAAAQSAIEEQPDDAKGYKLLCAAYFRKARETGDFGLYARAERALDRVNDLVPGDPEALKLRATLLLAHHRFGEALEVAKRARALAPYDHDVYGALTDALVELGDYEAAVEAAQRMVDLRPETSSYARVSYLRSLHGDTEGAIEAMASAARSANPADPEMRAWCYVHLGDELMTAGKPDLAEVAYDRALHVFPDYHSGLAAKARARAAAGDAEAAIALYRKALERVPTPDTAIALGDLYASSGRTEEANREYALVEAIERASSGGTGVYSRQMALFWADRGTKLDEALAIAERERAARSDIFTCDTLAWCLYKKGRYAEAKAASDEAMRLGTRDPRLQQHAKAIAEALGG